jgi:hypothetical protein
MHRPFSSGRQLRTALPVYVGIGMVMLVNQGSDVTLFRRGGLRLLFRLIEPFHELDELVPLRHVCRELCEYVFKNLRCIVRNRDTFFLAQAVDAFAD